MSATNRGACPYQQCGTTEGPWDGGLMVKRCPSDRQHLRALHAWQDPEGDADAKTSYKFPHHEVSASGDVGDANTRACSAVIAALNGGRGGTDIPDGDRNAVYNHVAHHMRDAGLTPPELNSIRSNHGVEHRTYAVEIRAAAQPDGKPKLEGHAAVFNSLSEPLGVWAQFREQIAPGAFADSIKTDDVRALFNHDPNFVLGRNKSGTLRLSEDSSGLAFDCDLPDNQTIRDLVLAPIERGDVSQCSFGFECVKDNWQINNDYEDDESEDNMDLRTLVQVRLFDVSPVTFPAYTQTDVAARDLLDTLRAHRAGRVKLAPSLAYWRNRLALAERI